MFAEGYAIAPNGAQAARRAGYSVKCAAQSAAQLLSLPHVKAYVDALIEKRRAAVVDIDLQVLEYLRNGIMADFTELFTDKCELKRVSEMPEDLRLFIEGMEFSETENSDGMGGSSVTTKRKAKIIPKAVLIDRYMKNRGMLAEKIELKADGDLVAMLEASRKRAKRQGRQLELDDLISEADDQ